MNTSTRPLLGTGALLCAAAIALTGCAPAASDASDEKPTTVATSPTPTAVETTDPDTSLPVVPGYDVGVFPPVPLFTLPDLSLLDESLGGFAIDVLDLVGERPGLDIRQAACGDAADRAAESGASDLYGDGSGNYVGADGEVRNYGDGSGSYTIDGVEVNVYGDGSGSYDGPNASIWNYGDGSGSYEADDLSVWVYGDGSGSRVDGDLEHWNYGDGSASYEDGDLEIWNYGDGSASYVDGDLEIWNYGDGTGAVNGTPVEVDPIPAEQPIGVFPPLGVIEPVESCGTTITLEDGVLFDFDQSVIRDDASDTLDVLAETMIELGVPVAEIGGHTDSIGDDDDNIDLSERRAEAVVAALIERGVPSDLSAVGYGETAPVAPNEIDGEDNPAGRQLNRRVEVFIPAF